MPSRVLKHQDGTSSPSKRRRRSRTLFTNGKELRELPLNYLRIEKPPRAVFEFLKTFYPQCKMNLSSLKTWTEVMAVLELCEEYKVSEMDAIKRKCVVYLKTIIS